MKVYINYNDKRWKKYKIDFHKIACASALKKSGAEVSIILTNDAEIHSLNKQYRNIDRPTNVLSFELKDPVLWGDIYISLDTVIREAQSAGISIEEHTAHMVVHGMLHLQGYDHLNNKDADVMEGKEIIILKKLGFANPYADEKTKEKKKWIGWKYIVACLLGCVASLGFAPFYQWWLCVGAVGFMYKIMTSNQKTHKLWLAFLFGAFYSISMFWWSLHSIYVVPELMHQFAIWTLPAVVGLGIIGGIIFGMPFFIISRMCTNPCARPFLFASAWSVVLWMREFVLTGFPWNPIANITIPFPIISNSMSVWGALGLSFIILGLIASIVELVQNRRSGLCLITFVIFCGLLVIGALGGEKNISYSKKQNNISPVVRIVQPAKSQSQKMGLSRADAIENAKQNIQHLINLANINDDNVQIIVFPETSYPFVITDNDNLPLANVLNKNIIIGATTYSNSKLYNSMIFADSFGDIIKKYSKSHLVPFGEYSPLGIMPSPANLARGGGAEIINIGTLKIAPAICYEIIFSDSLVPRGADVDVIINLTNDTWFGKTPGTYQHLDMVRRYAIESGIPVIRANYSGISAFVLSDGTIVNSLPVGVSGSIDGSVWGAHKTLYRTLGRDGTMILILLFACLCVLFIEKSNK